MHPQPETLERGRPVGQAVSSHAFTATVTVSHYQSLHVQENEFRRARYFLGHLPVLQPFITPAAAARIRCGTRSCALAA